MWPVLQDRVVILSSEFPPGPGGIGTHAHQLALQLVHHGWHVVVASPQELSGGSEIETFNHAQPFRVVRLRQPPTIVAKLGYRAAVIARLLRSERPHLIVASGERMVWLAAALAGRTPVVAIGHAMEFNVPARWQRVLNRQTYQRAANVICVSEYTASRMRQLGVRPMHAEVIPNGADESRFGLCEQRDRRAFRDRHGLGDSPFLITVGSVHPRKGQDVVIRALPRILERHPNMHYVSIGQPYKRDEFMEIARSLGVADRVHILGVLSADEVVHGLNAATLFVMASQHTPNGDFEGFGIAVVEAALCGRAAVVSDNSGVMEAIEPGETGLVATISDPRSIADRVNELMDSPDRLARMSTLARERAITYKTWTMRGVEYDRALRKVLAA